MKKFILLILLFCIISITSVGGGLLYHFKKKKDEEEAILLEKKKEIASRIGTKSNYIKPTEKGLVTVKHGEIKAVGGVGTVEVELEKDVGETTKGKEVDQNVLNLVHQYGIDKCEKDVSYGLIDDTKMYVKDGCIGLFTYKGKTGPCNSPRGAREECPIGDHKIDHGLKLSGLTIPKLKLLKDHSMNSCKDGTYGIENSNEMFAKDGCKGLFQYGTLFGYCSSHRNDDGDYDKAICQMGKTEVDLKYNNTDIRRMKRIGLRSDLLKLDKRYKAECVPFESNEKIYYNLSGNADKIYVWNGCNGKFKWGPYEGQCMSVNKTGKTYCDLSKIDDKNNGFKLSTLW
jgi:hypothetical protein